MERWLRSQLSVRSDVSRIALRHAGVGAKGHDVESFQIPEGLTIETLPSFANEILGRAQADADGLGGIQRYALQIYCGDKSIARFAFRLRGQEDEFDDSISGEEAPTMRGLLQQLMRHNEANTRTMTLGLQGIVGNLVRRIESQDRLIDGLVEKRHKDLEIIEEAKNEQHNRDLEAFLAHAKEERTDKMFEKLALLVPVVINKLAGQKIMGNDDPGLLMIRTFASSLSPSQLEQIQSGLSMEQRLVLFEILKSVSPKQLPPNGGGS